VLAAFAAVLALGSATPASAATLQSLTCKSASVISGGSDSCTVKLSAAAPSGGTVITLTSSTSLLVAPASVTVAANATTATFQVTSKAVGQTYNTTLYAKSSGVALTYAIQLQPPTLSAITCTNSTIAASSTDNCTVALTGVAVSPGVAVTLKSNSTLLTTPSSVTVAASASSASFTVQAGAVSTSTAASLTATSGTISKSFAVELGTASRPQLTLASSSIAFGNVVVDEPATQTVVLTSSGTSALTLSAITVSGTGYSVSGLSLPLTLAPGASATLNVIFDPTTVSSSATAGTVTLASNSSTGAASIALSGTGVTPNYAVDLSWVAPTSSTDAVAGYGIYRASNGSASYSLVGTTTGTTSFVDTTVANGNTYAYYVVSEDASGNISSPSSVYSAKIP
jgi:hypothetical protein